MQGNQLLLEQLQVAAAFPPADLGAAAVNGDWIDIRDSDGVVFLVAMDQGAAGDDPAITVQVAKSNTGTDGEKFDLTTLRDGGKGVVFKKQGNNLLSAVAAWEEAHGDIVTAAGATKGTITNTDWGENELLLAIEIRPDEITAGFTHIRLQTADVGAVGKLAAGLALVKTHWSRKPTKMPSVIG